MNTGPIIRPTDDAAQAALALPTPAPGSHAVTTDLALSQVVAAASIFPHAQPYRQSIPHVSTRLAANSSISLEAGRTPVYLC
jgi:hypothetical protein